MKKIIAIVLKKFVHNQEDSIRLQTFIGKFFQVDHLGGIRLFGLVFKTKTDFTKFDTNLGDGRFFRFRRF